MVVLAGILSRISVCFDFEGFWWLKKYLDIVAVGAYDALLVSFSPAGTMFKVLSVVEL